MGASPAVAQLKSVQGILSGVVRDAAGTPQMGASVEVIPELAAASAPLGFFTNTQGIFRGERLAPGFYTVRVTLAGFLPTLEKHIRVSANLTTLVRIQMESIFLPLSSCGALLLLPPPKRTIGSGCFARRVPYVRCFSGLKRIL